MREVTPYILAGLTYLITAIVQFYKLKNEMEFIKGQLQQLMEFKTDLKSMGNDLTATKANLMRINFDVNNAHDKIRDMERKATNGK